MRCGAPEAHGLVAKRRGRLLLSGWPVSIVLFVCVRHEMYSVHANKHYACTSLDSVCVIQVSTAEWGGRSEKRWDRSSRDHNKAAHE